jgi:DNA-binding XRE family transcriptional regulator
LKTHQKVALLDNSLYLCSRMSEKKDGMENRNLKSLDRFVEEQYGKRGVTKREKFEKGYKDFKLGVLLRQARMERGLTQMQLAERLGTDKGYISKIENNVKDVRLSTLQRVVEYGLGCKLELAIRL